MSACRLPAEVWRAQAAHHRRRVHKLLSPGFVAGSDKLDDANPVYNFLSQYYNVRGTKGIRRLARWSPGLDVLLEGATQQDIVSGGVSSRACNTSMLTKKGLALCPEGATYKSRDFVASSEPAAYIWNHSLLCRTQQNPIVLNCFGMHEWAMVYQPDHRPAFSAKYQSALRFRLSQADVNSVVESNELRCSHLDALRMFSPAAQQLPNQFGNIGSKTRESQTSIEQAACVHSSLDLFRFAWKLSPFCSSGIVMDCLEMALKARRVDVAAGPYDCLEYGIDPILVETEQGKREYRNRQIQLMKEGKTVRDALIAQYEGLIGKFEESESTCAHMRSKT